MKRKNLLGMERLEQRDTPATSGIGWGYAKHLTLSFVPDGTNVNGQPSVLSQTMNAVAPAANWQTEILRAFQTWAKEASINVNTISDSGDPLGSPGAVQNDPRFGDIRISAVPLPSGTIATNTPFLRSGSTWAGDVVINSNYPFSIGGANQTVDLYTAMLNEAGNVFGVLDSTTDPTSGTYYQYTGPKAGVNADNIADMRSLYGNRLPDDLEGSSGNNTFASAKGLDFKKQSVIQADITTSTDIDFYKLTVPSGVSGMRVELDAKGTSTLVGRVEVYNGTQQLVAAASQNGPNGADPRLLVANPVSNGTYFVKVSAAAGTSLQVGSYKLRVVYEYSNGGNSFVDKFVAATDNDLVQYISRELTASGMNVSTDTIIKAVVQTGENHTNDLLSKAGELRSLNLGTSTAPRVIGIVQGAIGDATDVDWYKVKAPSIKTGTLRLGVVVWALDSNNGLASKVEVFDRNGVRVPAQVLANEGGRFSIELANAASGADYYVKVSALKPGGTRGTGQYNIQATFDTAPAAQFNTYANLTLNATTPQTAGTVTVDQNQLMQFVFGGTTTAGVAMLRMDVFDAAGNSVYSLSTYTDQPAASASFYAPAGTYTVVFTAVAAPGTALGNVSFSLLGRKLSDPIGPMTVSSPNTNTSTWSPNWAPPPSSNQYARLTFSWFNPYYW